MLELAVDTLRRAVAIPGAAAWAVLFLARLLGGKRSRPAMQILAAAAFAVGLGTGVVALDYYEKLIPADPWLTLRAWQRLPYPAVFALAAGLVTAATGLPLVVRGGLRLAIALVAVWVLLRPGADGEPLRLDFLAGLGAMVFLVWIILDALATRVAGWQVLCSLLIIASATGAVIMAAGFMKLAELALIPAAISAAAVVACFREQDGSTVRGLAPGFAVMLPGSLAAGYLETQTYTDVPTLCFLLTAIAPLGLGVGLLPPVQRLALWKRLMIQAPAFLVPLAMALALAAQAVLDASNE
jgi:hypothetical protein